MAPASPCRRRRLFGFDRSRRSAPGTTVLLPIALVVLLVNVNWLRSAYGRAWMAIHHRDIAAESLGINAARYKLLAFSASTALTCFAGALWAYHTGFVSVEAFDFHMLIQYLAMVIIGGLGSVLGCHPRRGVRGRAAACHQHRGRQAADAAGDGRQASSSCRSGCSA